MNSKLTIEVNWSSKFKQSHVSVIRLVVVVLIQDDLLNKVRFR